MIIVNDPALAYEVLEKRSARHSSRPKQHFAGEMYVAPHRETTYRTPTNMTDAIFCRIGWENSLGLSPYSSQFRAYRKKTAKVVGSPTAASRFNRLQEAEVGYFLLHLLDSPKGLVEHFRKLSFYLLVVPRSVLTLMVHQRSRLGHLEDSLRLQRRTAWERPLINLAGDATDKFAKAGVPGA